MGNILSEEEKGDPIDLTLLTILIAGEIFTAIIVLIGKLISRADEFSKNSKLLNGQLYPEIYNMEHQYNKDIRASNTKDEKITMNYNYIPETVGTTKINANGNTITSKVTQVGNTTIVSSAFINKSILKNKNLKINETTVKTSIIKKSIEKIKNNTKKITKPLIKTAKKITKPLIKTAKKITKPLIKTAKKITKPLIKTAKKITKSISNFANKSKTILKKFLRR